MRTGGITAGQRECCHSRVTDNGSHLTRSDQERLKDAIRISRFFEEILERERTLWNARSVLDQNRISRTQGGNCESDDLPKRKVPRHDSENGAKRLKCHEAPLPFRLDLAIRQIGGRVFGVEPARPNALFDFFNGRAKGFAHLTRHELSVTLLGSFESFGQAPCEPRALIRGPLLPNVKCVPRPNERPFDLIV